MIHKSIDLTSDKKSHYNNPSFDRTISNSKLSGATSPYNEKGSNASKNPLEHKLDDIPDENNLIKHN